MYRRSASVRISILLVALLMGGMLLMLDQPATIAHPQPDQSRECITLTTGRNAATVPCTMTTEAACEQIAAQGGSASEIERWDAEIGNWVGHVCGLPFGDFEMRPDEVYYIRSQANSVWCPCIESTWDVTRRGDILHIGYGSGGHFPEYGALHLNDSYFRLNYSPTSGWGTSVILLPVFWSQAHCPPPGLCQGAPITVTWQVEDEDLMLFVDGTIGGLSVSSEVRLSPPEGNAITADVTTSVAGDVPLDDRPGEAFKPVMLSSMHISERAWDARTAYIDSHTFPIPIPPQGEGRWIVWPPVVGDTFGLQGGTSCWKTNAPTIEVELDRSLQITGWVTGTDNPNHDNVGFWAASDEVLPSWNYELRAMAPPGPDIRCIYVPAILKETVQGRVAP